MNMRLAILMCHAQWTALALGAISALVQRNVMVEHKQSLTQFKYGMRTAAPNVLQRHRNRGRVIPNRALSTVRADGVHGESVQSRVVVEDVERGVMSLNGTNNMEAMPVLHRKKRNAVLKNARLIVKGAGQHGVHALRRAALALRHVPTPSGSTRNLVVPHVRAFCKNTKIAMKSHAQLIAWVLGPLGRIVRKSAELAPVHVIKVLRLKLRMVERNVPIQRRKVATQNHVQWIAKVIGMTGVLARKIVRQVREAGPGK